MPRGYRGMDSYWWLEQTGRLARTIDEVDPRKARAEPSLQLVGRTAAEPDSDDLDLAALQSRGVQLVGRLASMDKRGVARFRDDLAATTAAADRDLHRFLDAVDTHIERTGLSSEVLPTIRPRPFVLPATPSLRLDLAAEGISTVLLAAGYRPHHPWLRLPITDQDGSIQQYRGITSAPGVYVIGQRFQHRRDSAMIDGARHDARAVVSHLCTGSTEPVSIEEGAR
jgi:putative flavoprotein involved in K+ transport